MSPPLTSALPVRLLQTQTDARLLELAGRGQERAFEAVVHRYRRPLLRYAHRLLLPEARAEDVVQQACLSAWLALQGGAEVTDARAWLYRIVHNTAITALRRSGYDHQELSETLRGAEAPEADLERRIAVRRALAGLAALPELQREALLRTALEGHSHQWVAQSLGLSEGAVRGLIYRGRATLRATATALVPAPVITWLAAGPRLRSPLAGRVAEVVGAGGSAGLAGVVLKGGAAVVSAGALATGVGLVHPKLAPHSASAAAPAATAPHRATTPAYLAAPAAAPAGRQARPSAVASPAGKRSAAGRRRPAGAAAPRPAAAPPVSGPVPVPGPGAATGETASAASPPGTDEHGSPPPAHGPGPGSSDAGGGGPGSSPQSQDATAAGGDGGGSSSSGGGAPARDSGSGSGSPGEPPDIADDPRGPSPGGPSPSGRVPDQAHHGSPAVTESPH